VGHKPQNLSRLCGYFFVTTLPSNEIIAIRHRNKGLIASQHYKKPV